MKLTVLLLILFPSTSSNSAPKPTDDYSCITKEGYVAAISEKYLDDVVRYSVDKDYQAIQKLLNAGVIVQMKKGVEVYIVDTHVFSGKVEFRVPGMTDVLWTVREALDCR